MIRDLLAGPAGSALAILALAAVTYLCRASGVLMMSRVRLTPRVERALRALPGSIVMATALPTGLAAGAPGVAGLATAAAVMALTRIELAAIAAGLAVVAAGRALGL
ncbi:AzlD family protein [Methylobacterium nodulans]|uniref:Branched-chain amino acid transport n=1 Tax=Methylobacterium nodulans (strain LMG 21967 / CNCM I-2342 / ORS 2060) TaxID=460265 RepID=B8IJA9_METNO|nr:AzlD domain-containing protein [Methylobacterium nodulans]ACL56124.1 branched-chain amino acid transport [Methylobacterium nodulans ORS 2060]